MNSPKKFILITGGQLYNKGAQAMTFTVVNELKKRYSRHRFVLVSSMDFNGRDSDFLRQFTFDIIDERFLTDRQDDYFDDVMKKHIGTVQDEKTQYILNRTLFAVDISGFMLSSQWGTYAALMFINRIRIAKHFGFDIYILPQSFGPFDFEDSDLGRFVIEQMEKYLTYPKIVCAREPRGYERMKQFCGNNLMLVSDIVLTHSPFNYDSIYLRKFEPKKIIVNKGSVAVVPNIRIATHGVGERAAFEIYRKITENLLKLNREVYLLAHSEEDGELCKEIMSEFDGMKVNYIDYPLNCIEFEMAIKQFDYAVVSRYHAAVHAYREGVPCLIIGWAEKYAALSELFNQQKYVFDCNDEMRMNCLPHVLEDLDKNHLVETKVIQNQFLQLNNSDIFSKIYPAFYAAYHKQREKILEASSGGVFGELCKVVVNNGGVVYGCSQNGIFDVRHERAETVLECEKFKRSKYLQSALVDVYKNVKMDLDNGKRVLFSGVGCQIQALKKYLNEENDLLSTCEVVCHGVPLWHIFRKFISEFEQKEGCTVKSINFRDKTYGWKNNHIAIHSTDGRIFREPSVTHPFHGGYLQGLYYRNSCGKCKTAKLPRIADITLADFWQYEGIIKNNNKDEGISLVVINSEKGTEIFRQAQENLFYEQVPESIAAKSCRHLTRSPADSPDRELFLKSVDRIGFYNARRLCSSQLMPAVREYFDKVSGCEVFALLADKKIPCYFFARPGVKDSYNYTSDARRRMKRTLSFTEMIKNTEQNEYDFHTLLKDRFSFEYISELTRIPPILKKGVMVVHNDAHSRLVNVVNGKRVVADAPAADRNIHIYGRCGVFGYAVSDAETLPSLLQKKLNNEGVFIKVINNGLWGATDANILANLYYDIKNEDIKANDIVVLYMWNFHDMELIKGCGVHYEDTTDYFHRFNISDYFYDKPGHMTAEGYQIIAECIFNKLKATNFTAKPADKELYEIVKLYAETVAADTQQNDGFYGQISEYLAGIQSTLPNDVWERKVGAIVVNCNPFTLGHRYLIEKAAGIVDFLIVFVVEENKSFFTFADRIDLVKKGCADLNNVFIFPSGNFIISTLTFPEYFLKEQLKEIDFNPVKDIEIFARHIAPALNISVRFCGTEKNDKVTLLYNDTMRKVLPKFGIDFIELERIAVDNAVISASTVRRYLNERNFAKIQKLVPQVTFDFLVRRYS